MFLFCSTILRFADFGRQRDPSELSFIRVSTYCLSNKCIRTYSYKVSICVRCLCFFSKMTSLNRKAIIINMICFRESSPFHSIIDVRLLSITLFGPQFHLRRCQCEPTTTTTAVTPSCSSSNFSLKVVIVVDYDQCRLLELTVVC